MPFVIDKTPGSAIGSTLASSIRAVVDVPRAMLVETLPTRTSIDSMDLDCYDRKLLKLLQGNNRLSQRELAEAINLSPSAVNRRVAALEEEGIIRGNVSIVDSALVGRPITIIVEVKLEN